MLMVPDAAGIYAEQEPAQIYDPALEAYRETKGLLWDYALEAWREVWPNTRYLVKDGAESQNYAVKSIPAVWEELTGLERRAPDIARHPGGITISQIIYKSAWYYGGIVVFGNTTYDLSKYNTLCVDWSGHAGVSYGSYGIGILAAVPPDNGTGNGIARISYGSGDTSNVRRVDTIDISGITAGIVGVHVNGPSVGASIPATDATIYNLWLE